MNPSYFATKQVKIDSSTINSWLDTHASKPILPIGFFSKAWRLSFGTSDSAIMKCGRSADIQRNIIRAVGFGITGVIFGFFLGRGLKVLFIHIWSFWQSFYLRSNHLGYIDDKLNQKITGNTTETTLFQVKIPKIFSPPSAARNSQLSVDSEDMSKGVPFAVQKSPENLINSIF